MRLFFLFAALLMLSACAETELVAHVAKQLPIPSDEPKQQSAGLFKVGNPYKIQGQWYRPKETYNYTETGIASWYGPKFHGKYTANGEVFDQNELTAAHRTLQMPSLVRVTNLENGRSLVVRVNDRGPFSRGRIIDVSSRAAELLGFKGRGTAKVRLDVLTNESMAVAEAAKRGYNTRGVEIAANENHLRPAKVAEDQYQQPTYVSQNQPMPEVSGRVREGRFLPDPVVQRGAPVSTKIYVQAGAFSNEDNAVRLAESLRTLNTTVIQTVMINDTPIHRVRLGPLTNVEQADALLIELAHNGYNDTQIIVD